MKFGRIFLCALAGIIFVGVKIFADDKELINAIATSHAVYVPDTSHSNDPLSDGVLMWDETSKSMDAAADQDQAHFTFSFTNVATRIDISLVTNVITTTNFITLTTVTAITNFTPISITILDVHPSCGCTKPELPSALPWTIQPGAHGQFGLAVDVAGKSGVLFKTVTVTTDKGQKVLNLRINILPPVVQTMTDAERMHDVAVAKIDRQAVFHGDCASCHVKPGEGKYNEALYAAVCAICHEAEHRATMVPDLHALKTPTNDAFWRTWIAHGKPGSFMPAFSQSDGGPLTDMQIASLAAYLDMEVPSNPAPAR